MTPSDYILQYHKRGDEIDRLKEYAEVRYQRGVMHGLAAAFGIGVACAVLVLFLLRG